MDITSFLNDRKITVNKMKYHESTKKVQRSTLLQCLGSQELSDVTFKIGEDQTEFHLNRLFLAMISPVFKAMLYGQMQEAQPNSDVIIEDITPDVFECIVHFAYCNDPKITSQNVLFVLAACDKYQITKFRKICYQFFNFDLSDSNFMHYYFTAVAVGFHDEKVVKTLERYVTKHYKHCPRDKDVCLFFNCLVQSHRYNFVPLFEKRFDESGSNAMAQILKSKGFLSMSMKSMRLFLKRSIKSKEEKLWTAVLRWARHQANSMEADDDSKHHEEDEITASTVSAAERSLLKSVRDLIRFGLMDSKYFSKHVMPTNVLSDKEVISVLRYGIDPQEGCGVFDTTRRVKRDQELSFTLKMSSKHLDCKNAASSLSTDNLSEGCMTCKETDPQIVAVFHDSVRIKKMEIAPLNTYSNHLLNSQIEIFDQKNRVWTMIHPKLVTQKGKIQALKWDDLKATKQVRIRRTGHTFLFVGFWKIYGHKE